MLSLEDDEVSDRLYTPCPKVISKFGPDDLIMTCEFDGRFFTRCCFHMKAVCHQYRIVYTDGACSNNGKLGAVSGIGIAFGMCQGDPEDEDTCQFAIPVDDRLDPGAKRTNQRAELLAALEGLKKIGSHDATRMAETRREHPRDSATSFVIITTDSEYVVKGMSQWLSNWKKNGLRKANGQRPSNLDLFCKLDAEVEAQERRHCCKVKFWHVRRDYNTIADQLAKRGASAAARDVNAGI